MGVGQGGDKRSFHIKDKFFGGLKKWHKEVKMKRYKVTGYIDVAVTTIVEVEDGAGLTEEKIGERAYDVFEGVGNYDGFGDGSHLIGVSGN